MPMEMVWWWRFWSRSSKFTINIGCDVIIAMIWVTHFYTYGIWLSCTATFYSLRCYYYSRISFVRWFLFFILDHTTLMDNGIEIKCLPPPPPGGYWLRPDYIIGMCERNAIIVNTALNARIKTLRLLSQATLQLACQILRFKSEISDFFYMLDWIKSNNNHTKLPA